METVFQWRRLFKQQRNNVFNANQKKNTLGQAAQQLGYKKKSLDDYLLQIRDGAKFGFDFEENKNKGIGKLRAFVRKQKNQAFERNNIGKSLKERRVFLKNLPFNCTTLTNEEISLLTDLKPVKPKPHHF